MTRTRIWNPEISYVLQPTPEPSIVVTLNHGRMEGYITTELIHKDTKEVHDRRHFKNVITDYWLDYIGFNATGWAAQMTYFCVGDGDVSGGITAHSSSLFNEIWRTTNNGNINDTGSWTPYPSASTGGYWSAIRTRLFLEGEANSTLTEIGASDGTVNRVSTHSAIRDASGSLSPIVKTSDYQLRITYEVRLIPPTELSSGSFVMNGITYNYLIGPQQIELAHCWGTSVGLFNRFGLTFPGGNVDNNGNIFAAAFSIRPAFWEYTNPPLISGSAWSASGSRQTADKAYVGHYETGSFTTSSYVGGTYERDVQLICDPGSVNFASGIGGLSYASNQWPDQGDTWAMKFSPNIMKTDLERFTIIIRHRWGRSADSE